MIASLFLPNTAVLDSSPPTTPALSAGEPIPPGSRANPPKIKLDDKDARRRSLIESLRDKVRPPARHQSP